MNLLFRAMTTDDLPAVFEVRASTLENAISIEELEQVHGITPASLAADMASHAAGRICEVDGAIVGFCMGDCANGEITVLAARPGFEDRGIGKRLLREVSDWLFEQGFEKIWLLSNPDPAVRAHGFYRRQGWQPDGRTIRNDEVLILNWTGEHG